MILPMNNEDNKYYTPSIEELYVGFEYERLNYNTGMFEEVKHPCDYIDWNMKQIQFKIHIKKEEIRVKYLDQKDIESLGWILDNKKINYKLSDYYLQHYNNQIRIYTSLDLSKGTYNNEIWLNIKNKSELKKLMQQLNII